jgi:hypothetical protein
MRARRGPCRSLACVALARPEGCVCRPPDARRTTWMTVNALSVIEQGADNVLGSVIDPPEPSRYGWRT